VITLFFLSQAGIALAACGSGFCPIITTPEELIKGQVRLDLSYEYIDQDEAFSDSHHSNGFQSNPQEPEEGHREIRTINHRLNLRLSAGITDRFTMDLHLPVIFRTHEHVDVEGPDEEFPQRFELSGIGDLVLMTRYALLVARTPQQPAFSLGMGVKTPTGPTDLQDVVIVDGEAEIEAAERSVQPGSGSWDPIFGLYWIQTFGPLTAFGNATYRIPTEDKGYTFGDELLVNVGSSIPLLKGLEGVGQLNLRWTARDKADGDPLVHANSGAVLLFLSPGLRAQMMSALTSYFYVQIPLYRHVNGSQLTADWQLVAGLTYKFAVGQ
jgi:hypothetical protein